MIFFSKKSDLSEKDINNFSKFDLEDESKLYSKFMLKESPYNVYKNLKDDGEYIYHYGLSDAGGLVEVIQGKATYSEPEYYKVDAEFTNREIDTERNTQSKNK